MALRVAGVSGSGPHVCKDIQCVAIKRELPKVLALIGVLGVLKADGLPSVVADVDVIAEIRERDKRRCADCISLHAGVRVDPARA